MQRINEVLQGQEQFLSKFLSTPTEARKDEDFNPLIKRDEGDQKEKSETESRMRYQLLSDKRLKLEYTRLEPFVISLSYGNM